MRVMTTAQATIQAVVFDWDGTLMDSKAALLASYHEATTKVLGEPFPVEHADIEQIVQLRALESFTIIARGDQEVYDRVAEAFHDAYRRNAQTTQPFPGTMEMLRALKDAGLKIGIATSKARARMDLEGVRTGINDLVDFSVTGDDVQDAKPAPEAVARAIAGLGVEPGRTLYVGDGPNDVIAGKGASAITVGVSFGFHPAEMREEHPDHVVDTPGEIVALARP
ncbi:HAD-IA family hydrolase [Conexibacter sp. W3-3-2]|nr:HAD-IA family hydrolase [Conexibacter sp. W3-3-2]